MSTGGSDNKSSGFQLPNYSTAPNIGAMGVGGGIYGNPAQVNQLSQPSGATLSQPGGLFGGQQPQQFSDILQNFAQQLQRPPQQSMLTPYQQQPQPQQMNSPFAQAASLMQGRTAMLNKQPGGMQGAGMQAGIGSLIPGYPFGSQ